MYWSEFAKHYPLMMWFTAQQFSWNYRLLVSSLVEWGVHTLAHIMSMYSFTNLWILARWIYFVISSSIVPLPITGHLWLFVVRDMSHAIPQAMEYELPNKQAQFICKCRDQAATVPPGQNPLRQLHCYCWASWQTLILYCKSLTGNSRVHCAPKWRVVLWARKT